MSRERAGTRYACCARLLVCDALGSPMNRFECGQVLAVNVKGYAFAMKHTFDALRARGGGSIVNLSSVTGFVAMKAVVPYCTTKGAIVVRAVLGWRVGVSLCAYLLCRVCVCGQQMTRCTALDMGKHGIRVNW